MSHPPAFRMEPFLDYLSFERGLSDRTLAAYQRDLGKLLAFLGERGVAGPGARACPVPIGMERFRRRRLR